MKMRTHFRQTADRFCEFFRNNPRFERSKTNPLDTIYLMHCLNQRQQILLFFRTFFSIRTQMDPCQYHFLTTGCCKPFHFPYNILCFFTADPSPCIRNHTIRTELIAAVLDFQVCSCMFFGTVDLQFFIFFCMIDIHTFRGFLLA